MSSDEFNKGYFSTGPQSSYDAQQGQWARQSEDRARTESEQRARAERENEAIAQSYSKLPSSREGAYSGEVSTRLRSGAPATFAGTVKGMAIVGCLIGLAYAYLGLPFGSWATLGLWAIKGVLVGAAAGIALYVAIVVLRVVFAILGVILKVALWAGLVFGGLYLVSRVL